MTGTDANSDALQLERGTEVEVRTRYEGRWAGGFKIDDVDGREGRYVLRRQSDGTVLPVAFRADDLRPCATNH